MHELYYIRDNRGNYYCLQEDQLVAAANPAGADLFSKEVIQQRIGSGMRSHFYHAEKVKSDDETSSDEPEEAEKTVIPEVYSTDHDMPDWKEYLRRFIEIVQDLPTYRQDLADDMSVTDQGICDVLHYIEFCQLTEQESLKAVDLLRRLRDQRRMIKDEMNSVDSFQMNLGTKANLIKAETSLKAIRGLDTRKYTPRQLTDLFAGCTMRTIEKDVPGSYPEEETPSCPVAETLFVASIAERKDTMFDGTQIDWLETARQQATFFSELQQHGANLKFDIQQIDTEIETILASLEDANYNCVQGYHVFRELKDLRAMRKTKEQELNMVEIYTEYFDCGKMQQTYEYAAHAMEEIIPEENDEVVEEEVKTAELRVV